MKILLIQPPQTILRYKTKTSQPSLGLGYIAAVIRDHHEVFILDALAEGFDEEENIDKSFIRYGLSFNKIKRFIEDIKPDVVGITCIFSTQILNAYKVCSIVKEIDPGIITIVGGHHPSAMPKKTLENTDIDFIIMGEAEDIILPLMEVLEERGNYYGIDSIGYRKDNKIILNKKASYLTELDKIPFPAWDLFPLDRYFKINRAHGGTVRVAPFFPVITSRGCPFNCVFCGSHVVGGKKYRQRSVDNVINELLYLKNKFYAKEVFFEDDNLTLDKKRAKELFLKMKSERIDIIWNPPNGLFSQSVDENMLQMMKESGCNSISLAVESADILTQKDIIKKSVDIDHVDSLLQKAKSIGLSTSVFLIVGFPGETMSQIKKTLRYARKVVADNVNIFFATPLPGSDLLRICEDLNLIEKSKVSFDIEDGLNFSHNLTSNRRIERSVHYTRFIIKIKLSVRNPKVFLKKIIQKIKNDPQYFIRYSKKILQSMNVF